MRLFNFFVLIICANNVKCYKQSPPKHATTKYNENNLNPIQYKSKHETNSIVIPVMIHFDKPLTTSLINKSRRRKLSNLKHISSEILSEVQRNFKHLSSDRIKFELVDTKFVKNTTRSMRMDQNGSRYLKSYCDWQRGRKEKKRKWYYSVLLTGLDLYYERRGRRVWTSTGRGYMNGVCSMARSCTVIEYKPRNIGYLLTHEIAHSLGLSHDGSPYNTCKARGFMMGARYNPSNQPRLWSSCNKLSLKKFLRSSRAWCLKPGAIP